MNWLSFLAEAARLFSIIFNTVREWTVAALGEAKGRAMSEAEHARAAEETGKAMEEIARNPAPREKIEKRLEEGSA